MLIANQVSATCSKAVTSMRSPDATCSISRFDSARTAWTRAHLSRFFAAGGAVLCAALAIAAATAKASAA
jgi:hypothetical protein